jgi:hypothetical protein
MGVYGHVCQHVCMGMYEHVCMGMYEHVVCVCMSMYVSMYACVCVSMYSWVCMTMYVTLSSCVVCVNQYIHSSGVPLDAFDYMRYIYGLHSQSIY